MNLQKFLERLFNIDNNTSATIIITILIFALGYFITSLIKGFEKYFTRQANRKLFLKTLDTLIKSLKKRKEVLKEQLKHLDVQTMTVVPVAKIQFFQIGILDSMGHRALFESFFIGLENILTCPSNKRLKNKAFIKVWENMANIDFWENNMYEQMLPAQAELNRLNETMGQDLQSMRVYYTELFAKGADPHLGITEKQFISELNVIVSNWVQQANNQHGFIVNEFLSTKIKVHCDKYVSLQMARELRNFAMGSIHWYGNIRLVILGLHKSLQEYDYSLSYFSRCTKKIIQILR